MRTRGFIMAALAAALYGTNPAFAVPLYGTGMNPVSVLFFRYMLGMPLLAAMLVWRSEGLLLKKGEVFPVAALGVVMAISSLALYESYSYMNPGVASTLLFMYPVLTSLIMSAFFHEKFRPVTGVCLAVMAAGLYLLTRTSGGALLSGKGFALVMLSSVTYAAYLVAVRVSKTLRMVPTIRSLLYQLLAGCLAYIVMLAPCGGLTIPHDSLQWANLAALAVFPTVLSLICTIRAINCIGPTPTAIFGALEPITAVALSVVLLGESVTAREMAGGALVVLATMLVVVGDQAEDAAKHALAAVKARLRQGRNG